MKLYQGLCAKCEKVYLMIHQMAAASGASIFRMVRQWGSWGGQDGADPAQLNYADFQKSHSWTGNVGFKVRPEMHTEARSVAAAPRYPGGSVLSWGLGLDPEHLSLLLTPCTPGPHPAHSGERLVGPYPPLLHSVPDTVPSPPTRDSHPRPVLTGGFLRAPGAPRRAQLARPHLELQCPSL